MSDEELVYLMREKNEDAETLFMQRYDSLIQKMSFKAVGYYAHDSEVKSMAYIVLMQCIQSYDDILNNLFSTYYQTCLRKRLNSLLKRNRYSEKSKWNYSYQDITEIEVKDYTLHDPIQKYIVEEVCEEVVNYLTPVERRVFQQCVEGYNSTEIAEREGVNIKKVYNTVHKIRKMLKN